MGNEINAKFVMEETKGKISNQDLQKKTSVENLIFTKNMLENMIAAKKKDEIKAQENISSHNKLPQSNAPIRAKPIVIVPAKRGAYIAAFKKYYVESKSHNLLLRAYSGAKAGYYSMMLLFSGMTRDEIDDLKKEVSVSAIAKNKELFNENENASELGIITGGSKKYIRSLNKVSNEIRNQLIVQCENLGLKGYFTKEKIMEIRIEQCQNIRSKLNEEKTNLEYKAKMVDLGAAADETFEDINKKVQKIDQFIKKCDTRIGILYRDLAKIETKKKYDAIRL